MTKIKKATEESKFTPVSAEAALRGKVKIEGKVITVPKGGVGLGALSAIDYLEAYCGAIVKYEHEKVSSEVVPADLRSKIL